MAVVGLFLALSACRFGHAASSGARPSGSTPLPSAGETIVYLAGPGRLIEQFRQLSTPLVHLRAREAAASALPTCRAVETNLNSSVDPAQLLAADRGIPDAPLAELALDERVARAELLVACEQGDAAGLDAAERAVDALAGAYDARRGQL